MPLKLHPECRTRLLEALTKVVPSLQVNNGMFLDKMTCWPLLLADKILPQTGALREQLVDYVDELPFTEFVLDTIRQELLDRNEYQRDSNPKLTELHGYSDVDAVANRLLVEFESLPWSYQLTFPLPEALAQLLSPLEPIVALSPSLRIVQAAELAREFPLETGIKGRDDRLSGNVSSLMIALGSPLKWSEGLYVQIAVEGFVGPYGGSGASAKAERLLRSFFGLGLGRLLFDYKHVISQSSQTSFVYVHKQNAAGSWLPITRYKLDEAISRGVAGLTLHEIILKSDMAKKITWCLTEISGVFRAGVSADPLLLAAQWLFDSYSGSDRLLSFIQSMVVLEILLGDKSASDEIGIVELISNRFAYLVGQTHEERVNILSTFKKIYRVRSQIVHSGKHRLTLDESMLFEQLRWMCRRAVDKEVDLLKAAQRTGAH